MTKRQLFDFLSIYLPLISHKNPVLCPSCAQKKIVSVDTIFFCAFNFPAFRNIRRYAESTE